MGKSKIDRIKALPEKFRPTTLKKMIELNPEYLNCYIMDIKIIYPTGSEARHFSTVKDHELAFLKSSLKVEENKS